MGAVAVAGICRPTARTNFDLTIVTSCRAVRSRQDNRVGLLSSAITTRPSTRSISRSVATPAEASRGKSYSAMHQRMLATLTRWPAYLFQPQWIDQSSSKKAESGVWKEVPQFENDFSAQSPGLAPIRLARWCRLHRRR